MPQEPPQVLDPDSVYGLSQFTAVSGINYARIRAAAKAGVDFPAFNVGRLLFIKGSDAIAYIIKLGELTKQQTESK